MCLHHPEHSVDRGSISPPLTTETKNEAEFEAMAFSKHFKWYRKVTFRESLSPDLQAIQGKLLSGELNCHYLQFIHVFIHPFLPSENDAGVSGSQAGD